LYLLNHDTFFKVDTDYHYRSGNPYGKS